MKHQRKREWEERDFIKQAKERGFIADVGKNLNNLPTLPDSEVIDPAYKRVFYVGKFSERSVAELKSAATDEMFYQQWQDFQKASNEPDYVQAIEGRPQASFGMQDAFTEVMKMNTLDFPVILLDVDTYSDFEGYIRDFILPDPRQGDKLNPDPFYRDFIWSTWEVVTAFQKAYKIPRSRDGEGHLLPIDPLPYARNEDGTLNITGRVIYDDLVLNMREDYDPQTPVLCLLLRKAIYGGTVFFVKDVPATPEDTDFNELADNAPLIQVGTALDYSEDDPRILHQFEANFLRETDGWLGLTIPASALLNILKDFFRRKTDGDGDGSDPGDGDGDGEGGIDDPGSYPPADPTDPGQPPSDGSGHTRQPPAGGSGGIVTMANCEDNLWFNREGTDHEAHLGDFFNPDRPPIGFDGLQNLIPIMELAESGGNYLDAIKTVCLTATEAAAVPSNARITSVTNCYFYEGMKFIGAQIDGRSLPVHLTLEYPRVRTHKTTTPGAAGSEFYWLKTSDIERLHSYEYEIEEGDTEEPTVVNFEMLKMTADDLRFTIKDLSKLDAVEVLWRGIPAEWNFWYGTHIHKPFLKIGVAGFTWKYEGFGFYIFGDTTPAAPAVNGNNFDFFNIPDPSKPTFGTHDLDPLIDYILLEVWSSGIGDPGYDNRIYCSSGDPSPDGDPQWGAAVTGGQQEARIGTAGAPVRTWWKRAAYSKIGWRYNAFITNISIRVVGHHKTDGTKFIEVPQQGTPNTATEPF